MQYKYRRTNLSAVGFDLHFFFTIFEYVYLLFYTVQYF